MAFFFFCRTIYICSAFDVHIFSFSGEKVVLLNKTKIDPCKSWVQISKVMPQPKSISPRKGREALWQKVQIFWLKYGTA